jgi:serine/threonine-protein kinase
LAPGSATAGSATRESAAASVSSGEKTAQTTTAQTIPTTAFEPSVPVLEHHEILGQIGAGGFGVIYKARDKTLNRFEAIKLLRCGALDAERAGRFEREAHAMARLDHPHIVPVFARGEYRGEPYYIMPFMPGGSMSGHKEELRKDPRRAVAVLIKVARAVQYLHEQGIVHRDLKPQNVLFAENGEPHVSDFGLAKLLDVDLELTNSGELLGTLPYMAPEQLNDAAGANGARAIGPGVDIWALGVMLFELLSGSRPFTGSDRPEVRRRIVADALPRLTIADAGPLNLILGKCLAKDPRERFASAGEFADDLERWLNGQPLRTQPRSWRQRIAGRVRRHPLIAAGALLLAVAVIGIALVAHATDPQRTVEAIQRDIRERRTAALLDREQTPRWQRWRLDPAVVKKAHGRDPAFAFQVQDLAILELLPATAANSFRVIAEVRHDDQGDRLSEVGLVLGLRSDSSPSRTVTQFLVLTFNDLEVLSDGRDNPAPLRYWVVDTAEVDGETRTRSYHHRFLLKPVFAPGQQFHGTGACRTLEATTTPASVMVRFDGILVGELTRADMDEQLALVRKTWIDLGDVAVSWDATGGIGLMIDRGEAAFRNVRIEPAPQAGR